MLGESLPGPVITEGLILLYLLCQLKPLSYHSICHRFFLFRTFWEIFIDGIELKLWRFHVAIGFQTGNMLTIH